MTAAPDTPAWASWQPAVADWPAGVQAGHTTRLGGHSQGPWAGFNLGDHVGDDPQAVAIHRAELAQGLGATPVFCRQVHGATVVRLTPNSPQGLEADASWTDAPGLACTMMVADCLPLLLAAPDGASVAAVHAGWRGLAGVAGQGVLEALVQAWPAAQARADRAALTVWLGPCIGPQAFEVGEEVRTAFVQHDPGATAGFRPVPDHPGKHWADLAWLARRRLQALGFKRLSGNDSSPAWCTVAQPSRLFSHRRDAARLGSTGRFAACIWRD
ncbi:peptidoglycan editing factor PgeF [Aquabacterium sp. A08]|uniref:peptidoglycan editing factor PgeF n=1 Tax=Aquabacterium sp. A08 TaxID=2718532 RepID=UPI0014216B08|nr:peptidoglycan editing factor PgeF [Aquabacterium sp. A08]